MTETTKKVVLEVHAELYKQLRNRWSAPVVFRIVPGDGNYDHLEFRSATEEYVSFQEAEVRPL